MKVCLICEGSYPYVTGGVSGWVQMILENTLDTEFVIWSIATNRDEMSRIKYEIPTNVVEIKTIYLSERKFAGSKSNIKLTKEECVSLKSLMKESDEEIKWVGILELIRNNKDRLVDILMGKDFFQIAVELYTENYSRTVFNDYLWNLRSMYFPLVSALSDEFPKADIYHSASTGYAGLIGSVAGHIFAKPFIVTEHGIYTREREEEIIKSDWVDGDFKNSWIGFFNKLSTIAYYKAEKVVTLYEDNKQLEIEAGCPEDKIIIIPNGVDVMKYENLLSKIDISRDTINIGVIARVVPIKDIKTMLLSFDVAKQSIPNLALYILGPVDEDKEYYAECLEMVSDLGISNVYFKGMVDVKEYLPSFDFMLLTSISEGQPIAMLEGMAASLPQISTNVGCCRELIEGSKNDYLGSAGIIVPVMNIERIGAAIIKLALDQKLRLNMGRIGHARVSKSYQNQTFLNSYHVLYNELNVNSEKVKENK